MTDCPNNSMRLTNSQLTIIKQTVANILGMDANVYLFGSRVDDMKKGGDVDLLIETQIDSKLLEKMRLQNELEAQLQLPVDLVITQYGKPQTPFQRIAFKHSILL
jgi:predicted nucleotidyltransferase